MDGKAKGKSVFLFGSELKALKAHPYFQGVIERDRLHSYCVITASPPHTQFTRVLPNCLRVIYHS